MEKSTNIIKDRLACIDVLRGFNMFFLVGAAEVIRRFIRGFDTDALDFIYRQLNHVEWEGFVAWDLIMPLFLFTSGLSMPYSFGKLFDKGYSKAKIYVKVLKRFCILFLLGWIVAGNLLDLNIATFHIYTNTLQSIAFGYLLTALIVLNIKNISGQLAAGISMVVVYWALMAFAPVPGIGSGVLTPDGNFALYIDKIILGSLMSPKSDYTWIISSLGFGATVFSGYYAGMLLKEKTNENQKLIKMTLIGVGLIVAGLLLSLHQPIIKKLWTSSMVLLSSGWSFLLLALTFFITDKMRIDCWWTRGFRMFGLNAITSYMLWQIFNLKGLSEYWTHGLEQYTGTFYPFFVALGTFGIIYFIIRHLYKYKIFIKV